MHRIDHQTAVGVKPEPKPAGTPGYFGRPNPALGIPATIVDADWLNMVQDELEAVLEEAAIPPEKFKNNQLSQAIIEIAKKNGVPAGGSVGMVLTKNSDGGVDWDIVSGVPEGGKAGQVLVKKSDADDDVEWKHVSGIPIGMEMMHYGSTPPPGCLVCDGSAVGRTSYPDLYAVIGTKYGAGDGSTTFNLPDKIGRFGQGSLTPGQKIEAGLPNIEGATGDNVLVKENFGTYTDGAFTITQTATEIIGGTGGYNRRGKLVLDASRSNPIYGASNTVQPPALTLLPCIKAFDAATNPGLIDITGLANEIANKTDRIAAAHAAMPSDKSVALTLPASGETIIAPTDGYIRIKLTGSNAGYFSADTSRGEYIASYIADYAFNSYFLFFPVAAGDTVTFYNTTSATVTNFSFVYANGSAQ